MREMAAPEPSAAGAGAGGESASQAAAVEPIRMPTVEEIKGQDIWNNCAVRSVVSGVMGERHCSRARELRLCFLFLSGVSGVSIIS